MTNPKPAAAAATRKLGKYELRGELGRGTHGAVYEGFDPFVQREVAIKIAVESDPNAHEKNQASRDAFFAEARAAGRLNHPYVVTLYDAGFEDGQHYIVMEKVVGESLRRYCFKEGVQLRVDRVIEIMMKCALALDYVHRSGVLHKDIKPGNIMLKADGAPKLMDFGIAAMGIAASEQTRVVAGSPMYMSPEQLRGESLSPASDLYSLGTVLFQLLCGEPPFNLAPPKELFRQIKHDPPRSLRALRDDLPEPLYAIVDKLLAKDAKQRHVNGKDLAEDLSMALNYKKGGSRRNTLAFTQDSLKKLKFFSAFKTKELGELMNASTTATYKPGEAVIREKETDNSLYILLAGIAEVRKDGQLIALLEKGDCFGEIGFLYAVKRTASVLATTDVLVLKINAALLEQMSEDVQLRYYKIFCESLIIRLTLTTEKAATLLPKSSMALDFIVA